MDFCSYIEEKFKIVDEITFNIYPFPGLTPHWVALCISDNPYFAEVVEAYKELYQKFKNDKCVLIFYERQYHMDISIVNEKTGDIINVNDLKFDFDQFPRFMEKIRPDEKIDLRIEYGGANILNPNPLLGLFISAQK